MEIAAKGCHIRHLIDLDQRSTDELRTALHIAVQQSNIDITRLLLENGAKDDWKDFVYRLAVRYDPTYNPGAFADPGDLLDYFMTIATLNFYY